MSGVTLKNAVKRFGEVEVIHGVDLEIDEGEFCVFVGPSGCGKSSLVKAVHATVVGEGHPLKLVELQREDIPSVGLWSLILARPDLDDETAYRLVRAMHLGHDDFAARLPQGRYTRAANSVRFVPAERLHPGARKFYAEIGLLP